MTAGAPGARLDAADHPWLLVDLERIAVEHPLDDKLLVCRPRGSGRELLHALAVAGDGWLGFRVQTPWELAVDLTAADLTLQRLQQIDRFEELARLDDAIDAVLSTPEGRVLAGLGEAAGFREALGGAVRELRLAGLEAGDLRGAALEDRAKRDALAAIQERYEGGLREDDRVDRADVLRRAVSLLGAETDPLEATRVVLMPGQSLRGLRGRFLSGLADHGAVTLGGDPVLGLDRPASVLQAPDREAVGRFSWLFAIEEAPRPRPPEDLFSPPDGGPEIEIFAAASPMDELREVLRRARSEGLRWDEVEIVATDWRTYGTALDALAPRLGIDVTHAAGLPISRTRAGRAVEGYLRWLQEDFAEEILRDLCQSNLLRAPADDDGAISGPKLARTLRGLRIGWGRDRTMQQIDWLLSGLDEEPSERDRARRTEEQIERGRQRRRAELDAVKALVEPLLDATPPTPDRLGARPVHVSPADLATGVLCLLRFVPDDREVDREALRRLRETLERIRGTLTRDTSFHSALAILRKAIDLRVPSPAAHGRVPWSSAGGHLHFSDLEHGGLSGRRRTFVVGIDSGRFPGPPPQNPLLLDRDRARLAPEELPSSADQLDESRHHFGTLLARLRGKVTLSYAAWDASEGRQLAPAASLLQALRLQRLDPATDYKDLHDLTRPLRGPVPHRVEPIERAGLWLDRLDRDHLLLRGVETVRRAHPGLDAGLTAAAARLAPELNRYNGAIQPRPDLIDPRRNQDLRVSATRLESLATCPLRYLYRYVLGLEAPEDLTFEPGVWLSPADRGKLFHRVYERVLHRARDEEIGWDDAALTSVAEEVLEGEIRRMRHRVPAPSQAVFDSERTELYADLAVFVQMLREERPEWLATELTFGFPAAEHGAVELPVGGGTVRLRGAVDRVDAIADRLRIVDYKTGSRWGYGEGTGIYNGGRRLQHALYTEATERLLERPVGSAEYHFPTRKGNRGIERYDRNDLERWPEILEALFTLIERGTFPPAHDDPAPCRFCDFKPICGVEEEYGKIDSPPVAWGRERHLEVDEYAPLLEVRAIDE